MVGYVGLPVEEPVPIAAHLHSRFTTVAGLLEPLDHAAGRSVLLAGESGQVTLPSQPLAVFFQGGLGLVVGQRRHRPLAHFRIGLRPQEQANRGCLFQLVGQQYKTCRVQVRRGDRHRRRIGVQLPDALKEPDQLRGDRLPVVGPVRRKDRRKMLLRGHASDSQRSKWT